mmetsp:Transcript_38149/g.151273  ORF Transcript_38149/g.151273 Transcript_38149/m.151273 type:complete len:139 (-) Transcript_38149:105-521(-)
MAVVLPGAKMQIEYLLNSRTASPDSAQHQCNVCFTRCRSAAHLRYHMFVHGDNRFHACRRCEIAFPRKFSLRSHVRCVHDKERKFACASCSSKFFYRKDLLKHKAAVHDRKRPYRCEDCPASFGKKEHLTRHRRSLHR